MKSDSIPSPSNGGTPGHQPFVAAGTIMPELTLPAVVVGAALGILFGASSLYLVLKVGMTVSASIPIAVLSITLFRAFSPIFGRNATILENNIVQTTGSAGESIAFGVGVTMPALLILGYDLELTRVMLVAVLGGLLGVLMMIPLRRVFIVKQHGTLAFPEGKACAEVLIVGEKGGTSAATVFAGFGFGFIYWFLADGLRVFKTIPTRLIESFRGASISCEVAPHLVGVGYIIGTRISCIMVAGGVLASWVLAPAIMFFGAALAEPLFPGTKPIGEMSPSDLRSAYVLYIGAGAVAAGGIISMLQAMPLILSSIGSGLRDISSKGTTEQSTARASRLDRDLSMKVVLLGCLGLILAIWAAPALNMNLVGALCIVGFGFLFVTVSARLTGEIGSSSNPISGMTVATLLMTCLIFLVLGWTTSSHKLTALSVAGIVCIAASNGGAVAQVLKTGHLVGGTPRAMQISILVGALTSALVIGATLLLLNNGGTVYSQKEAPKATIPLKGDERKERVRGPYAELDRNEYAAVHVHAGEFKDVPAGKYLLESSGAIKYFVDPAINGRLAAQDDGTPAGKYDAPKAMLMSFLIDGILSQKMPWTLVLLGVAIALVLELSGIPSLPFAVGVYLPLSASTPIFVGGVICWLVKKRSAANDVGDAGPGVLLSSGLIAGGTIAGVVAVVLNLMMPTLGNAGAALLGETAGADWFAMIPFGALVVFLILVAGGWWLKGSSTR